MSKQTLVEGIRRHLDLFKEEVVNEYLVKEGEPIMDALYLNVFEDLLGPEETIYDMMPELRNNSKWERAISGMTQEAADLEMTIKKLQQQRRTLTAAEAKAIEATWYDGSDSYTDVRDAIEYLPQRYRSQLNVMQAVVNGDIEDDDEVSYL